jgi:hypothetical protein
MSRGGRLGTGPLAACVAKSGRPEDGPPAPVQGTNPRSVCDNSASPPSGTRMPIRIVQGRSLANPLTASFSFDHAHSGIGRFEGAPSLDADRKH